jgi:hypothetical protein
MTKEEIESRIEAIEYILEMRLYNEEFENEIIQELQKLQNSLKEPKEDKVNPKHYPNGSFDFMRSCAVNKDQFIGYCRFTAMKYLIRLEAKDEPLINAKKAQYFINELVKDLS